MIIVADSALQLSYETIQSLGIEVVEYPMYLNGEPYSVSISMSREEKDKLRLLLKDKDNKVTTSGLREEDLLGIYNKYKGEKIISLHQSGRASTATAAVIKKVLSENSELDIIYIDAHHLTAAYSVLVQAAAEAVKEGKSFDEVIELIEKSRTNTNHLGVVYDLFYLHRTGRIGLAKAILGTAMKIISILGSSDEPGVLKAIGKVKTSAQANQRFIKIIKDDVETKSGTRIKGVISVIGPHEKEAEHLKMLTDNLGKEIGTATDIEIHYTNHSNMPHAGPDFYDIGYIIYG
ncbi:MAG: DegV family EDD domain-containing protein [Spirochaetales bacterium]|nr:DegV family EDD domain-containing protein [Spirochaetales bacterium]